MAAQVFCEVCKQVSVYSLQHENSGKYPFPNTVMVVISELVKLVVTVVRLYFEGKLAGEMTVLGLVW